MRKSIGALVVYKNKQGTCGMQWDRFGYEHLGGGAFDNTLVAWIAGYNQRRGYWLDIKGMEVNAGVDYGLDCALIK